MELCRGEGPPHPALGININDIDMSGYILDWIKCWRIFANNVMELYWIEMVVSMITNVAKIGENCDFEYAFSIGSEDFLPSRTIRLSWIFDERQCETKGPQHVHQPPSAFGADNLLVEIGGTVTSWASVPPWPFCANTMFIQSDAFR